ncbi:hypothetical protein FFWV33_13665 [Flavobacterium faecale]|uniref:Uncharacterized protein n=1 Tax=Flavobacterium faecale TaxID=1355330 RepID=A0A2S1LIN9_9FLAO|nr:hypothetical protein FFWV33_13665 [Flavobacterium faecale]
MAFEKAEFLNTPEKDKLSYIEALIATKQYYPFEKWREKSSKYGLLQYTEDNCTAAKNIFDTLLEKLIKTGENGEIKKKEKYFEIAVLALNELNDVEQGLIETGEREDLCELIDKITIAAGLNPKNYAKGEGIADLWREW